MNCTVLGASGFIGSHLVQALHERGHSCAAPSRENLSAALDGKLGHVFYCIGLTADFRGRPFDTVDAHVSLLARVLQHAAFESFVYLSSTRVYAGASSANEDESLRVNPLVGDELYNISKIMGESLCLSIPRSDVRVVRLSNVVGADYDSENFLTTVVRDALVKGSVTLGVARESAKDFVSLSDVVSVLPRVAFGGKRRLYNIASGTNVEYGQLLAMIQSRTGCEVRWEEGARKIVFPAISIDRIRAEFGFCPTALEQSLEQLIRGFHDDQTNRSRSRK